MHPVAAVTLVVEDPAADVRVAEVGVTPNVQVIPLWVTVTGWPATVSVPTRCDVEVFAVALKVTVPLPLPLAPLLMVSHPALLVAVHVQPVAAVTLVVDDPAAEVSVRDVGETPKVQEMPLSADGDRLAGDRERADALDVDVLAAALKVTVPLPLPLAPPLMVSHPALLVAVHVHPVRRRDVRGRPPAADVRVGDVGETPKVQEMPLWVTVTVWPATVSVPTRWRCRRVGGGVEGDRAVAVAAGPAADGEPPGAAGRGPGAARGRRHGGGRRPGRRGQRARGRRDREGAGDAALGDGDRLAGDGQRADALRGRRVGGRRRR